MKINGSIIKGNRTPALVFALIAMVILQIMAINSITVRENMALMRLWTHQEYLDALAGTELLAPKEWDNIVSHPSVRGSNNGCIVFLFTPHDCSLCMREIMILNGFANNPDNSIDIVGLCITSRSRIYDQFRATWDPRFYCTQIPNRSILLDGPLATPVLIRTSSDGTIRKLKIVQADLVSLDELSTWAIEEEGIAY